jgi:hypothetical protein
MNNKEQKIERFFEQSIHTGALNISVLKNHNNEYILFGKYLIKQDKGLYLVTLEDGNTALFSALKVAATWCVFHDKNRITECKEIENADFKLASIETDIIQHNRILDKSKDGQVRMLYYSKIENDESRKKILVEKLNKYINMSTRWQNSRYDKAKPTHKR